MARNRELEAAGYHAQVKVSEKNTSLFRILEGQRVPIRVKDGGFVTGKKQETLEEALRAVEQHPEEFSPSVLLRPVIQDALLPCGVRATRLPLGPETIVSLIEAARSN